VPLSLQPFGLVEINPKGGHILLVVRLKKHT